MQGHYRFVLDRYHPCLNYRFKITHSKEAFPAPSPSSEASGKSIWKITNCLELFLHHWEIWRSCNTSGQVITLSQVIYIHIKKRKTSINIMTLIVHIFCPHPQPCRHTTFYTWVPLCAHNLRLQQQSQVLSINGTLLPIPARLSPKYLYEKF